MDAKTDDRLGEPDSGEMNGLMTRLMVGVNGQAFRSLGNRVISGPFAGMVIPSVTPWSDGNFSVKLLGIYEFELHDSMVHAAWRQPRVVVNVGCAEGYYAVGLARMISSAEIFAFDVSGDSRNVCSKYAFENGVGDRVRVAGGCDLPYELSVTDAPSGHRLYVVDVEGAERTLLDLKQCPVLKNSDVIVECHDFLDRDVSCDLADRFSSTHRVELILSKIPRLDQFPFLSGSPTIMLALMAVEKRPVPCCWLACWANQRGVN